jgi:FAD/FMN-containing dehydrogenase
MAQETIPRTTSPSQAAVDRLKAALRGEVIQPGDPAYDAARRVYNGMIDKRPALVARCADVADVLAAVGFARALGLPLAVRGGGHNAAGLGTCDGGLVVDLGRMRGVRVDPAGRTARVEGGATWGDVDHATHAFGLATPSGIISTTGVGGLTLGGGFGHLSRKHGLTCDNLLSADVVTADGRLVTASADQHPDLFWGVRGGGGNFGVVTSFEFRLHPVGTVLGGPIFYPIDRAEELLRFYREFIAGAPEELGAFFGFHLAPPAPFVPEALHNVPMALFVVCYNGPIDRGEEAIKPLREVVPPALDLVSALPYPALQGMFDALQPPGLHHYWKADFDAELTDEMIAVHLEHGPRVPSVPSLMHLYPLNGAIQRVDKDATAFSYRDVNFAHVILATNDDPAPMPDYIRWARDYWSALHPHSAGGAYVNFLMDEGNERVRATYRDNYARLQAVKATYDPDNLFRVNQNITPTA